MLTTFSCIHKPLTKPTTTNYLAKDYPSLGHLLFFEICPGLHANAKIAILAKNRKTRKHRKSVAIFAILTIFAKIAKIAKDRKNRKNSQKLEKTRPSNLLRFSRLINDLII